MRLPLVLVCLLALAACAEDASLATDRPDASTAADTLAPAAPDPDAPPVAVTADSVTYRGIDVSHFQGSVDWAAARAGGIVFGFAKATEGRSEVDPEFAANWSAMREAGVVRGAYHFFDPDVDAEAQADHFIATVQLAPGDLPPALDIEVTDGVSRAGIDADIRVWLQKVEAAYGVTPIVYSDVSFLEDYLASGFSAYPLWIARYSDDAPDAPGDWDAWTFWQWSQSGTVAGVSGAVDRDVYVGTEAGWNALRLGS